MFSSYLFNYHFYHMVQNTQRSGAPIFKGVLTDNPPSPGKVDHTTRVYVPYCFQTVV